MASEFLPVYVRLDAFNTDPVQFKPYNPTLVPAPYRVYVRIFVPAESVVDYDPEFRQPPTDGIVLSPKGLAILMSSISQAIRDHLEAS